MIKVFVADDHPVVLEGLRRIVAGDPYLALAGEAATCAETFRKVLDADVDVLLLDLQMPGRGGLEVLRDIKRERPGMPVLVLSQLPEDPYAIRSIQAGASGFLTKMSIPDELVDAIKKVASGRKYISPAVAEQLAIHISDARPERPHESLSQREFQVLCMIGNGMTISEISDELALSVKTVSTYRTRLLDKMGLRNNAQLIRYAIENTLV